VLLTAKGRTAGRELERQEVAFAHQVLERLPPERREAVASAFHELLAAVREATEECCPGAYEHLMEGLPGSEESAASTCGCESLPCTQEAHMKLHVGRDRVGGRTPA
jgi:hypothetical protein